MLRFRFDDETHTYFDLDTGEVLPHITGMLLRCGEVDDRWFTEESCVRGTAVHKLTADYDLGAIADPRAVVSRYGGYLQAWAGAVRALGSPRWEAIEEPIAHSILRYAGRPDRDGYTFDARAVTEVKSGERHASHCIQTALQAILLSPKTKIPPHHYARYCVYVKANGRFQVDEHTNRHDFDRAYAIIGECCERRVA